MHELNIKAREVWKIMYLRNVLLYQVISLRGAKISTVTKNPWNVTAESDGLRRTPKRLLSTVSLGTVDSTT